MDHDCRLRMSRRGLLKYVLFAVAGAFSKLPWAPLVSAQPIGVDAAEQLSARARKLHFSSLVVDTHADTTQRLLDAKFDLAVRDARGSVDIPRMREGGLGALFFALWISSKVTGPVAVKRAEQQIA